MAKTLSEAIDEYLTYRKGAGYAVNTLHIDQGNLSVFMREVGNLQMRHLDVRHGEQYQTYLTGKGYKPNTVNSHLGSLRSFCTWARARRYLAAGSDPTAHLRTMKRDVTPRLRIASRDFERLLDAAPHPHERIVVALGLYLFLRQSEIVSLTVGDVDLTAGEITVTVHKSKVVDVMPICEELDRELRRWLTWYANDLDGPLERTYFLVPRRRMPLFTNDGSGRGGGRVVWRDKGNCVPTMRLPHCHHLVQRTLRAFGLDIGKGEGNHTLRRSGARAYFDDEVAKGDVRDGVLREVQALLHHKNSATTEIYLGLEADRERRNARLKGRRMFGSADREAVTHLHRVQ